jgi:hypothetical protein
MGEPITESNLSLRAPRKEPIWTAPGDCDRQSGSAHND